jgi:S-adenosylmethionine:tRNA ribosyltransferase-isomerase
MKGDLTSDYDFELPEASIAQTPAGKRDESKLMVVRRDTNDIEHRTFRDIVDIIPSGDAIVVNTTRVFKARLLGHRDSGAPAEILLLKSVGADKFEAMVHPGGKLKAGRKVHIGPELDVEILETTGRRTRIVQLHARIPAEEAIEKYGHVPLPPYIHRSDDPSDMERYQTVYARESGSVAAPTAGLHFTSDVLDRLAMKGVARADIVLHVGAGTFKPVEADDPANPVMHEESYWIPGEAASALNATRAREGSIWATGTTSVRALESVVASDGRFVASSGDTRIFIRPPYRFKAVDHLITNFHLPRSTLLMLVAAFAGYELIMRAYREAIDTGYRFYSYGDAMVIV